MESELEKYKNVSKAELEKIWETSQYPKFSQVIFESTVSNIHNRREFQKINGRESLIAGPLIQVLSVHVLPDNHNHNHNHNHNLSALTFYGTIHCECPGVGDDAVSGQEAIPHYNVVYDRECYESQAVGPSGALSLTSPDSSVEPFGICMPFHKSKIIVDICARDRDRDRDRDRIFAGQFCCATADDTSSRLEEQVKVEYLRNEFGAIALRYIAMPFAVYGRVRLLFFHESDSRNDRSLKLCGNVIARYANTFGGCDSEECVLFDKHDDFEQVQFDGKGSLNLSTSWLAVPIYSSLFIHVDLWEFGSNRKFLNETVEVRVRDNRILDPLFVVDDILVILDVGWFSPRPLGAHCCQESSSMELDNEESDNRSSADEHMYQSRVFKVPSSLKRPWRLMPHRSRPTPSPSIEIFSIYIGQKQSTVLQIYGFVEVSSGTRTFYGFKREARDAYDVPQESTTVSVVDGPRGYDECCALEMRVDVKDTQNRLHVRGHMDWSSRTFEFGKEWLNKQLCSVFQGEEGFAAIHYSIFPEAVQAKIQVSCTAKDECVVDMLPKISGCIAAKYNNYDYTSCYNKDYYRVTLFERKQEEGAETGADGVIPLSRAAMVVPMNSSLVLEVNLDHILTETVEFQIGVENRTLENNDYLIDVHLKWVEVDE